MSTENSNQNNTPSLPDTMPGIDVKDGLGRVRGNIKLYLMLLNQYAGGTDEYSGVDKLIEANDIKGAAEKAHAIKGIAGNLGIKTVFEKALTLEGLLKNENSDADRIAGAKALDDSRTEAVASIELLKEYLK